MSDDSEIELQYNARKTIHDHVEIAARWDEEAEAYRNEADWDPGIAYGPGERNRFDFFRGKGAAKDAPVLVFIHGGYWRSRGRETFSHVARSFNARGISVAIPSYDHCPNVTVMDIIGQMRSCIAKVWEMTGQHLAVAGHSAGGHLTASMIGTDWSEVDGVPDDIIRSAFGISGLYELEPLLETTVNDDLKLTAEVARAASPMLWPAPPAGSEYVAAVGDGESEAFKSQSRRMADAWNRDGVVTEYLEIADTNHLTVINALNAPGSALADRIATMAEQAARG